LAKELYNSADSDEAKLRSAISRAYYAVFCIARKKTGIMTRKSTDHKKVADYFKRDKRTQKIYENLRRLRNDRNRADYDDVFPNLRRQAEKALKIAEQTLSLLKRSFDDYLDKKRRKE